MRGYKGGSGIINCKYGPEKYSNHTKYFCRVKEGRCEDILNQTENKRDLTGKFFAVDEILTGVYSMIIRNISQEDEGNYMCKVKNQPETLLNLKLNVGNGEILLLNPGLFEAFE